MFLFANLSIIDDTLGKSVAASFLSVVAFKTRIAFLVVLCTYLFLNLLAVGLIIKSKHDIIELFGIIFFIFSSQGLLDFCRVSTMVWWFWYTFVFLIIINSGYVIEHSGYDLFRDHKIWAILLACLGLYFHKPTKLALHERPIHCSDKKRETLYIKNDTWEKDTNNKNTKKFINKLCSKQVISINKLVHNPDEYVDMLQQCSSDLNEKKLMKDICDIVYVNDPNLDSDTINPSES